MKKESDESVNFSMMALENRVRREIYQVGKVQNED